MRRVTHIAVAGSALVALLAAFSAPAGAQSSADDLERRLSIVERQLDNAALGQMYNQLQRLQQELQQLRGQLDVLDRRIQAMEDRQRDIYIDLDTRLRALETGDSAGGNESSAPPPASIAPPPTDTPPSQPPQQGESPAPAPTGATTAVGGASAQAAYRAAFDTLNSGRYGEATAQFTDYLEQYPDSAYADNARYWLGESYYVVRRFDEALKQFQRVLDDYPGSPKRADALLKIGFIHYETGRLDQSRKTLEKVVREYPDSTAANLARQRLERMGQ